MHPILFEIGPLPIASYGVMIMLGLLTGLPLAAWLGKRRGLPPEFFYDFTLLMIVSGFIGARLFYIGQNFDDFRADPLGLLFARQGFVFLGGFLFAIAVGLWTIRRRGIPVWEVCDIAGVVLPLGHAFGRLGCFFAGCCFGEACTPGAHPWLEKLGVSYPVLMEQGQAARQFNFAYWTQVEQGLLAPGAQATLPMIPVQLLEAVGNVLICAGLYLLWRRRRYAGQIFGLYLMIYATLRFVLEFWRGDTYRGLYFGGLLSTSQLITIATFVAGAVILWLRRGHTGLPLQGRVSGEKKSGVLNPETGG